MGKPKPSVVVGCIASVHGPRYFVEMRGGPGQVERVGDDLTQAEADKLAAKTRAVIDAALGAARRFRVVMVRAVGRR